MSFSIQVCYSKGMKIAIDVSPLSTGHRVRGTGFYLHHLQQSLLTYFPENSYQFFTKRQEITDKPDIIHFPYFDPFFITLPVIKTTKIAITVHDLTPLVFPNEFPSGIKGNIRWQIQKLLLKQADVVITDSNSSKRDIMLFVGIEEEKIHTVYLAAGEDFKVLPKHKAGDITAKFNLPKRFALYVGDATWNKNLPRLIEAAVLANVPLVMVGKALSSENTIDTTNPWNKDLMTTISFAKEHRNIHRIGFVSMEELISLYNMASVFVMPSLYEGFGLPILEAMACGVPVITSKEGSLHEVAGNAAYYIDAYNSQTIADAIHTLWWDTKLQKELSSRGLEQAKSFSWKKTAEATLSAYKMAL